MVAPETHGVSPALPPPSPLAGYWRLDPHTVFLNHGSFGACPVAVVAEQRRIQDVLETEPVRFFVELLDDMLVRARRALAEFLGAPADSVAFVANATEGVNTILKSLGFSRGDELLVTNHEYGACLRAFRQHAESRGLGVAVADIPVPLPNDAAAAERIVVDAVLAKVTPRTKLALVSHITSPTGLVFPIETIIRELDRRGIDTLADGAHAPGMLDLDLAKLAPAYYTGNCHKWMYAPKGCAFICVREDRRERIHPLVTSHGNFIPYGSTDRFRLDFDFTGTRDYSPFLTLPFLISYVNLLHPAGWRGIREDSHALARRARRILIDGAGVSPIAPESMLGSLAAVALPPLPAAVSRGLLPTRYQHPFQQRVIDRYRVQVPIYNFPDEGTLLLRISAAPHNAEEQYRYLARALAAEFRGG